MRTTAVVQRIVHTVFPRGRVLAAEPLTDGFRNSNFRIRLDRAPEWVVLRIYEHQASLCQKELDLFRLVGGSVPVPEVLHAEPRGFEDLPPFALLRYVEGITFRDLKRTGDREAVAQAAFSAGETLAAIGRLTFPKPGWLDAGPVVTKPLLEGADPMPRFVDLCLASENLQSRMEADLRDRTSALVWSWAPRLAELATEVHLVHGDFNKRNVLVRRIAERWCVAAVLDWEFAVSGTPLEDIANFLRYEPLCHFTRGYLQAGGSLPSDWQPLSRVVGLLALCESLTHDQLPADVIAELLVLVRATVAGC